MIKNTFYLFFSLLLTGLLPVFALDVSDEIVIEMKGPQTKARPEQYIWDKDAKQLTKFFRGKNKAYVLQTIDAISAQEQELVSSTGKVYILVQYGQDTKDYRKFLFEQATPQTFVTAAASAADVIAIFQRYDVNMNLRKNDFLATYSNLESPTSLVNGNTTLTFYTLPPYQLPLAAKQPVFAVFEGNRLIKLLNGNKNLEMYQKTLQPAPAPQPQTKQAPQPAVAAQKQNRPYKALLSGGTVTDRMYMPRVVSGPFTPKTSQNKSQPGK